MLLSPTPDVNLYKLFSSLETDFLKSVIDSDSSTEKFADRFRGLHDTSLSKLLGSPLTTIAAAHRAASNISLLSASFSELELASEEIKEGLMLDIDGILQQLTLEEPLSTPHAQRRSAKTDIDSSCPSASKSIDSEIATQNFEAWDWLTEHLDNPYPSLSEKRALCKSCGHTMKVINEWFSQMRRRIGWTSLLKRHFKGDRQLTLDCAHRILVEGSGPLYYSNDIIRDVENMRIVAGRLYAKNCRRGNFSMTFDNKITERLGFSLLPSSQLPFPISNLTQTSPHEDVDLAYLPRRIELGSEPRHVANSRSTIKRKRTRDASSNDMQTLLDYWSDGLLEAPRPTKRLKNLEALEMKTVSRSASFSTASSRESTTELMTPPLLTTTLPIGPPFDAINSWMSGFVGEASSHVPSNSSGCRKRRTSDSTHLEPVKRSRNEDFSIRRPPKSELDPLASLILDSSCDIFSQFDFSLPPPATYFSGLHAGEPLQLNSFTYSNGLFESSEVSQNNVSKLDVHPVHFPAGLGNAEDSHVPSDIMGDAALGESPNFHSGSYLDFLESSADFNVENKGGDASEDARVTAPLSDLSYEIIPSSFPTPSALSSDVTATIHLTKLERINQLLAEANKLQQEVFG